MGLSVSKLLSVWSEILKHKFFSNAMEVVVQRSMSFKNWESNEVQTNAAFKEEDEQSLDSTSSKNPAGQGGGGAIQITTPTISLPEPVMLFSSELDAAATKLQKVYKSYRTRRNLADCAVVIEELWWKTLDSVSLFNIEKPRTAVSRWALGRTRAAKIGKGLSKDEKARKLALQHWLEAIDPRHRYGHNLHFYYDVWSDSKSSQPFFYWLDVGDGKEVNLDKCPRIDVQRQCIRYLGPKEREAYEVIVENGKLVYRQNGMPVDTIEGFKSIFVLSTSRCLYVGDKKKGEFQHSSFLSGAATTAAGRLVAHDGVLEAIWPYSGHYLPTEDNFKEFISFLEEHQMDITNVKRCAIDEDKNVSVKVVIGMEESKTANVSSEEVDGADSRTAKDDAEEDSLGRKQIRKGLSCNWTSGVGPRIGCVRDYPTDLQSKALEQVNLSPKPNGSASSISCAPIPSPRPSPKVRLSPRLAYMGLPSPRVRVDC